MGATVVLAQLMGPKPGVAVEEAAQRARPGMAIRGAVPMVAGLGPRPSREEDPVVRVQRGRRPRPGRMAARQSVGQVEAVAVVAMNRPGPARAAAQASMGRWSLPGMMYRRSPMSKAMRPLPTKIR